VVYIINTEVHFLVIYMLWINMDHKEKRQDGTDWINLAQNRNTCWGSVITTMKL